MLLRLQKGLSQQGLAEACNVTHQAVSKWETGAALPDMQTMLFLSRFFGVPMEDILSGDLSLDVQETAPEPADAEALPSPAAAAEQPLSTALPNIETGAPSLSWDQIIDLAPFAGQKTLDALAERCREPLDKEKLCDLAAFLSPAYLDKLVRQLGPADPALALELAPFLSSKTLNWLLLGGQNTDTILKLKY